MSDSASTASLEESVSDAEAALESVENRALSAVFDPFTETWAAIGDGIASGLGVTLRHGIDGHRQAIVESGLDGVAPASRSDRAERLITYRHATTGVLDDLALQFGARAPASTIAARLTTAMHAAVAAVGELPAHEDMAWSPDAMARHSSDTRSRRARKALARAFGMGRRTGRVRSVPVRAVAQAHLRKNLLPAVDEAARRAALEWAAWGQDFERAWITWADVILDLVVRAGQAEEREPEAVWAGAAEAAEDLQQELERLASASPVGMTEGEGSRLLGPSRASMAADLSAAGGFVYTPPLAAGVEWALPGLERVRAGLAVLDEGVGTRLTLYSTLLGMLEGAEAVRRRLLERFEEECLTSIRSLRSLADDLTTRSAQVPRSDDPATLSVALEAFREQVGSGRPSAISLVPEAEVVEEILDGGAQSMVEALGAIVRQSPEELLLTPAEISLKSRRLKVEVRALPLQQLALQSFDVLRIERIRLSTVELQEAVERLRGNLQELENVFRFAFESAREELDAGEPETAVEHAPRLVQDALRNIADSLRQEVAEVEGAFLAAGDLLNEEISDGALGLLERVAAGGMQAQMLAAQSRLASGWAWAAERWGPEVSRYSRRVRYYALRAHRIGMRGYRAGRRMVAGATGEEVVSTRMVRVLSDAAAIMRELPPVYQRLFTLQPLTEATFVVGREQDLAEGVARWRRFEVGEAGALVLRGHPGCGMSTFLNALERAVSTEGASTALLRPASRIESEAEWAAALAGAVGLPAVETLEELSGRIRSSDDGTLPRMVVVDNLEHIFLRVPGGVELVDRTLTFMTETEARILWICGLTLSAWQQIATAAPMAVAQIDSAELTRLDAAGIRSAVMLRHRRSGLPLQYAEPKGKRMLKRKLRRVTSPEAVRSVLADDFFEQLERTSSGQLRLAFFQWLQSCDFEQSEGLVIRPPVRPDFSALDSLTLAQAFTLKAFVEHRTLTLAEHDRIFRVSRRQSTQILESLMNRRLIAAVDTSSSHETLDRDGGHRYRIHGLLVGAVIEHLRSRNIVH